MFCTQAELLAQVRSHYTTQSIREVYKVLGSLDFLGNPVKLFGHLGHGLTDLFYEPFQADDTLMALGRGTKSLLANSAAGAVGVFGGITNAYVGNRLHGGSQRALRRKFFHHAWPMVVRQDG